MFGNDTAIASNIGEHTGTSIAEGMALGAALGPIGALMGGVLGAAFSGDFGGALGLGTGDVGAAAGAGAGPGGLGGPGTGGVGTLTAGGMGGGTNVTTPVTTKTIPAPNDTTPNPVEPPSIFSLNEEAEKAARSVRKRTGRQSMLYSNPAAMANSFIYIPTLEAV
jgi:hypothetical protein